MKDLTAKPIAPRASAYRPGIIVWIIVALALMTMSFVWLINPWGDEGIRNLFSLLLAIIAFTTIFVWFVLVSRYHISLRVGALVLVVGHIALFFSLYKVVRTDGSLWPKFALRSALPRDATLGEHKPAIVEKAVDLAKTTPQDFPRFLGPNGDGRLPNVQLAHTWSERPPQLVWKHAIGAGWSGFSAVNGYAVTLEQRGPEEQITCYEVATGKLRWVHRETGRHETILGFVGPRSTPTIHDGKVFATTALGVLVCLDGRDGRQLWRVDLLERFGSDRQKEDAEIFWGRANSPLIVDDLVVVPAGGPVTKPVSLAAFSQKNGELVWQAGETQISYCSPVLTTLCGVRQIISVNESNVTGHVPETGKILWTADWPGDSSANASNSQPHVVGENQLLLTKGYSAGLRMLEFTRSARGEFKHEIAWENNRMLRTKFTNVAIVNGFAYGLNESVLECVDLAEQKTVWKGTPRRKGDYGHGQVLAVGDVLLVQQEQGAITMVALDPSELRELGTFPALADQTWNNLCVSGSYLLVRNAEEAACYRLELREAEKK